MRRMWERNIKIGLYWIIGYPDETEESMRATMTLAAEMKTRYPNCTSEVLLYRPLPGTESGQHAERNGYEMPLEFETWGSMVEYKFGNKTYELLPPAIRRDYHRYTYLVPWFDGLVKGDLCPDQAEDVDGTAGVSRLVVASGEDEILIPFASEICTTIDADGKRIVIEPPEGLLELNRVRR